jgi:hypothetical protein
MIDLHVGVSLNPSWENHDRPPASLLGAGAGREIGPVNVASFH